jgi:hypothetical protein
MLKVILILIFSWASCAQAQPVGYTEGTQVCWTFSGRGHGYFRAVGWNASTDHILIFFGGDGQTDCTNYDGMQPGLFLRDGAGGSNWDGVTNLPAEVGGGSRKWLVFIMTAHGNQPDVYAADVTTFLNTVGVTIDASMSGRIHYGGGSGGPGRANSFFNEVPSNPYRTFHSTGIWMSTTLYTVSANSPTRNYCWYGDADANPGTPPSFTINVYNQLPGVDNVDKYLGVTSGGTHSNSTWGACFQISGTTYSDNRWIWMIVEGEDLIDDPVYPPVHKLTLNTGMWFDVVGSNKPTHLLIDGDTTTTGYPNFFDGYIITQNHHEGLWIVLDSFINTPKIRVFNNNSSAIDIGVTFYYGRSDTSRHSQTYTMDLPDAAWGYLDSFNTRAYSDSVRLIKIDIPDIPNGLCEIHVYGNTLGAAPSIYPAPLPAPADPGRYFQGYGKVFTDTATDQAGYTQRHQNDMGWLDTAKRAAQQVGGTWTDGKTMVYNQYGNSEPNLIISKRNGREQWMYAANVRVAAEDPLGNVQRKDIIPFSDSTDLASWVYVERAHFMFAAWFGYNTGVNTTGYSFLNVPGAERGRGYFRYIEIGNEDMQHWNGPNKFHSPRVQYLKIWAGYNGAKAADPNIKVITGAATGLRPDRFRALFFVNWWYYQKDSEDFPADAFAFNEYSTNAGGQHGAEPPYDGISPETFLLKEKLDSNIYIRNLMFPGKEMFCTEFGYDGYNYGVTGSTLDTTDHASNYNVPDVPGQTRDQTKSYWTLRWYEHLAGSGWDRAMQYTQRNIAGTDFATTGFSYDIALPGNPSTYLPAFYQEFIPGRWTTGGCCSTLPSDLYWHMTCRAYRLYNYSARATVLANGDSTGVWLQRYPHMTNSDSLIYSVWMGTDNNSATNNYQFSIPNVATATLVTPTIGDKDGATTPLNVTGTTVTIPSVNEGVQYILVTLADGASTIRNFFRGGFFRNKFKNLQ